MLIESFKDLYHFLYNRLIDISNSDVHTIHYLIGPKWKVCKAKDTVKIARNALLYCKENIVNIKSFTSDIKYEEKISLLIKTLNDIASAKEDSWDDGLFDKVYYCYAEDTVEKAKKCLKIVNEYI